ncbi:MAG: hypothetical protein JEY96_07385 [Bacteroidales bacterium]|nr:hypothetical protein [Bacteroidales bacterium]
MSEILEILKYTTPALIVFLSSWLILKQLIKNDQHKRNYEMVIKNQQITTPIRLQAYERFALLLERISPESLIMRLNKPKMTTQQLQTELLNNIRSEFDHNVSQQIYITPQTWEIIKSTRTNIIKLINTATKRIKPNAPAFELGKAILEDLMLLEKSPINIALEVLKKEVRQLY